MKNFLVLLLSFTISLAIYGERERFQNEQEVNVFEEEEIGSLLVISIEEELNSIAREQGYILKTDSVNITLIDVISGGFVPRETLDDFFGVFFGGSIGGIIAYMSAFEVLKARGGLRLPIAAAAGVGGAIIGIAGGISFIRAVGRIDADIEEKLYRAELHYSLESRNETIDGSCTLFYTMDSNALSYTIDDCSHETIFPQDKKGILRRVFNTDLIEQYTSGLESVVANGSI